MTMVTSATTPKRPRGRPRDPGIDSAIRTAAWTVLAEQGARRLSPERVAEQAGVAVSTIYRRFRSGDEILMALLSEVYAEVPVPDTGSVRGDLMELMQQVVAAWSPAPRRRSLYVGFVAAQEDNAELARTYQTFMRTRRRATTAIIGRAIDRGEIHAVDGNLVMDLLSGLVAQRLIILRTTFTAQAATEAVDTILDGLRSREPSSD